MKKLTLTFFLLLHFSFVNGQIVTPGFTHYTSCPTSYSEVNLCTGWRQPTGGTSDYFNVCAAGTGVGVPTNFFGHQDSPDSAYAGLYTYGGPGFEYREYIGTTIAPLVVGRAYTMSIRVSLADTSYFATDGLGVFFSTFEVNDSVYQMALRFTPQVDYSSYGILRDKENWVTLSKTFVADSAYTNLVVGCFKFDSFVKVDSFPSLLNNGLFAAYYYISNIGTQSSSTPIDTALPVIVSDTVKYAFPSGFTPNHDGSNDVFRIKTAYLDLLLKYSLSVFNRFGERVFYSENPTEGWDGMFKNEPQEIGTYYYFAMFSANGREVIERGDVTLVR